MLFIEDNTIGSNSRMTEDDDIARSVSWLSYLGVYWIWEDDAPDILKFLRHDDTGERLNEKSVIDVIYAAKRYRKLKGEPHMTEDELIRFRIFSRFRKTRGTLRYPVFHMRNVVTGHIMEYIQGRKFVKRYD
jgi:hypothetical protein